jgi:predicted metal-binding membrane protein
VAGPTSAIEAALRRDRTVVAAALAVVAAASWLYTLAGVGMPAMGPAAPAVHHWSPAHAALMVAMWWVMMAAMMLPSAAPLVLLFAAIRRRRSDGRADADAALVAAGYLAAWGLFSLAATLAQRGLELGGLLSPATMAVDGPLAGVLLLAAGLYQLTPVKQACLRRCRSPAAFLAEHWRPGPMGAFRMGLAHGAQCVGCCWFLMGLLFVGGVMHPLWIGGLALFVAAEKLAPRGGLLSRAAGLLLAGWGVVALAGIV